MLYQGRANRRPGISSYLLDYCALRGAKLLCQGLLGSWPLHYERARDYSCMSARMRKQVRKTWTEKHQEAYLAAIQIRWDQILQAKGYDNSSVEDDPQLYAAIEKWRLRYGLRWGEPSDEELYLGEQYLGDDVPMPF